MRDEQKTKAQLIDELAGLRRRIAKLEAPLSTPETPVEQQAYWRVLLEHAPLVIASVNRDGVILFVNRDGPEAAGANIFDYLSPEEQNKAKQILQTLFESGQKQEYETTVCRPNGSRVWYKNHVAPVTRQGQVVAALYMSVDITARKQAEAELQTHHRRMEELVAERTAQLHERMAEVDRLNQALTNLLEDLQITNQKLQDTTRQLARANAELESFTYSVSHDLKAPLRGIDGYARLLLEDYAPHLNEEGRAFLQNICRAAAQMHSLIDDLLAYSRLERRPLKPGRVNLPALLESLIAERQADIQQRGVELTLDLACQTIRADTESLAQALRNLLDNALKFTAGITRPAIKITAHQTQKRCIITVQDNGVGFDMQYQNRIFDIFQRLHPAADYPGTGIGLAIVRKAVERNGGRVWAKSAPGEGATFYLELGEHHESS